MQQTNFLFGPALCSPGTFREKERNEGVKREIWMRVWRHDILLLNSLWKSVGQTVNTQVQTSMRADRWPCALRRSRYGSDARWQLRIDANDLKTVNLKTPQNPEGWTQQTARGLGFLLHTKGEKKEKILRWRVLLFVDTSFAQCYFAVCDSDWGLKNYTTVFTWLILIYTA